MAYKTVVTSSFFEKMIEFVRNLEMPVTLAMLDAPSLSGPVRWNLSLASPSLDARPLREVTIDISDRVSEALGEDSRYYGSTHIRRTGDYLVRSLVPIMDVPEMGTAYRVDALELALFNLDEVVVLVANPAYLPVAQSA